MLSTGKIRPGKISHLALWELNVCLFRAGGFVPGDQLGALKPALLDSGPVAASASCIVDLRSLTGTYSDEDLERSVSGMPTPDLGPRLNGADPYHVFLVAPWSGAEIVAEQLSVYLRRFHRTQIAVAKTIQNAWAIAAPGKPMPIAARMFLNGT